MRLVGSLLGALLGDPALVGLDFAFPALFIVLVIGFWKGAATGMILIASATASVITHHYIAGAWYIAAGATAGLLTALATGPLARRVSR